MQSGSARSKERRVWILLVAAILVGAIVHSALAQTTAPIPGYAHVDGLVGAKVTDGTRTAHVTVTSLDVNCTGGCAGSGGGAASLSTNYGWTGSAWVPLLVDAGGRGIVNVNGSVAVTGPLTDAQMRASPIPVQANLASVGGWPVKTGTGLSGIGVPRVTVSADSFPTNAAQENGGNLAAAVTSLTTVVANLQTLIATNQAILNRQADGSAVVNVSKDNLSSVGGWPVQIGVGNAGPGIPRVTVSADSFPTNAARENGGNLAAAVAAMQVLIAVNQAGLSNLTNGSQVTQISNPQPPLNPFLPRCNAVRRTNCQP